MKFAEKRRFAPLKQALRQKHGLASHWSVTHSMWWSALRYGTTASDRKPSVDPKPLLWTWNGHPVDMFAESQQPYMATVVRKRREMSALQSSKHTSAKCTPREKFTKFDLTALILTEDLKTPAQVMHYVQQSGSVAMQTFVNRCQKGLYKAAVTAHTAQTFGTNSQIFSTESLHPCRDGLHQTPVSRHVSPRLST